MEKSWKGSQPVSKPSFYKSSETAPNACQQVSKNSARNRPKFQCSFYLPVSTPRNHPVRLLTEGDPELPAALLVWGSLYSGDTLRFISAMQSIDRPYVYTVNRLTVSVTVWECHEKNGIGNWEPLQQLHTRTSVSRWDGCWSGLSCFWLFFLVLFSVHSIPIYFFGVTSLFFFGSPFFHFFPFYLFIYLCVSCGRGWCFVSCGELRTMVVFYV